MPSALYTYTSPTPHTYLQSTPPTPSPSNLLGPSSTGTHPTMLAQPSHSTLVSPPRLLSLPTLRPPSPTCDTLAKILFQLPNFTWRTS